MKRPVRRKVPTKSIDRYYEDDSGGCHHWWLWILLALVFVLIVALASSRTVSVERACDRADTPSASADVSNSIAVITNAKPASLTKKVQQQKARSALLRTNIIHAAKAGQLKMYETARVEQSESVDGAESQDSEKPVKPNRVPKASADAWAFGHHRIIKDDEPTLNVVIDASRDDWKSADVWSNDLSKALFPLCRKVFVNINVAFLELNAKALKNANMIVLARCNRVSYSKAEKTVLQQFMERGGTVLAIVPSNVNDRPCESSMDLLTVQNAKFEEIPKIETGKAVVPSLELREAMEESFGEVEFHPAQSQRYLITDEKGCWDPIIVDSKDGSRALAAVKRIGKGRFVYLSSAIAMGEDWNSNKHINTGLLGRLIDGIAVSGLQVDVSKPFSEVPVQSASSVRLKECDTPVYYASQYETGVRLLKKELDAILPHVRKELGIAYQPLDSDICLVAKGSGRSHCSKGCSRRKDSEGNDLKIYQIDVACTSPLEGLLMDDWRHRGSFIAMFYDTTVCDYYWLLDNNRGWGSAEFVRAMRNYQMFRILRAAKFEAMADRYREFCSRDAEVVDGHEVTRDRYFKVYDELCKRNDKILTRTLDKISRRYCNQDFFSPLTIDQFAKIVADVLYHLDPRPFSGTPRKAEAYVENLFNDVLFTNTTVRLDLEKAKFERPPDTTGELPWVWSDEGKARKERMPNRRIRLPSGRTIDMVGCPAGRFRMAWDATNSVSHQHWHEVSITRPFWIAKTQITKRQWCEVMNQAKIQSLSTVERALGGPESAADGLSPWDVEEFCRRMNKYHAGIVRPGYEFRPPTEAEWEYALKANSEEWHSASFAGLSVEGARDVAWLQQESILLLKEKEVKYRLQDALPMAQVATKRANGWGLYDMIGNGWEYVADRFEIDSGFDLSNEDVFRMHVQYADKKSDPVTKSESVSAFVLMRGGGFLYGKGFGKQLVQVRKGKISKDMTFRLVLGPKLTLDSKKK